MLGFEHTGFQRLRRVGRQYRHFRSRQDLARIELLGYDMDAAATDNIAGLEGPLVSVEPPVFRKQRGVDVDHSAGPSAGEVGRQDPHEPGKRYRSDAMVL